MDSGEDAYHYSQDAWDVIPERLARRLSQGDWEPVVARWREAVDPSDV